MTKIVTKCSKNSQKNSQEVVKIKPKARNVGRTKSIKLKELKKIVKNQVWWGISQAKLGILRLGKILASCSLMGADNEVDS